jgi:hypothetical protein
MWSAAIALVQGQVSTTNVDDPVQLATTILSSTGAAISIVAARKAGSSGQFGIFQQNGVFESFPATGIILSSGLVENVVGPNDTTGRGTDNQGAGDADLDKLLPPGSGDTNDAAVLEIDFTVAKSDVVSFQYVFGSEEYTEYIGEFNDVFAFFLNGKNIALLPNGDTVSINNVNCGKGNTNPAAPNCGLFVNNENKSRNTQLDGFTKTLTAQGQALAGQTNTLKIAVADTRDFVFDSMVLIAAKSFQAGTNPPTKAPVPSAPVVPTAPVTTASPVAAKPPVVASPAMSMKGDGKMDGSMGAGMNGPMGSGKGVPKTGGTMMTSDMGGGMSPGMGDKMQGDKMNSAMGKAPMSAMMM